MNASVVPRWFRDPERLHERREPVLGLLRSHRGGPGEIFGRRAEGGRPGGAGGDGGHVAGEWGLPVRLAETHNVFRGLRWWEVLKGNLAVFFASVSVTDGQGRVGFVEVTVAP